MSVIFFFFQAEDGIRDYKVTGVQTCALPIYRHEVDDGHERQGARQGPGIGRRGVLDLPADRRGIVPPAVVPDALRDPDPESAEKRLPGVRERPKRRRHRCGSEDPAPHRHHGEQRERREHRRDEPPRGRPYGARAPQVEPRRPPNQHQRDEPPLKAAEPRREEPDVLEEQHWIDRHVDQRVDPGEPPVPEPPEAPEGGYYVWV